MLHEFLSHPKIAALYEGQTIARLLPQRWSGHLTVSRAVFSNFSAILDVLEKIRSGSFSGDDVATSVGLLTVMKKTGFRFTLILMKHLLGLIEPADKMLQCRETGLTSAMAIMDTTCSAVRDLRTPEVLQSLILEANSLVPTDDCGSTLALKRKRTINKALQDYIITETIGQTSDNSLEVTFFDTIDTVCCELERRFGDNCELLGAIASVKELDATKMLPLSSLGIDFPSKEELIVVKAYLEKKKSVEPFTDIYQQRVAFENTYKLLATVETFGCSTSMCESAFSVLTRINCPQRQSMSQECQSDLVYLAFESMRTKNIDMEKFLHRFNSSKNRRLQLF